MLPVGDDNPNQRGLPVITLLLVLLNVLVFAYQSTLDERALSLFVRDWGVIPARIENGEAYYTLLTSMFVHGGLAHIGSNMLFLWIFADNIERRFGHLLFLIFYLATGLAAGIAHIVTNPGSIVPTIGASGAVSGVLGAYLLLYPTNRVRLLIGLWGYIQVRAFLFLGARFGLQLLSGLATLGSPEGVQMAGVAFWAHVGGFVAGVAGALVLRPLRPEPPPVRVGFERWFPPSNRDPWL